MLPITECPVAMDSQLLAERRGAWPGRVGARKNEIGVLFREDAVKPV